MNYFEKTFSKSPKKRCFFSLWVKGKTILSTLNGKEAEDMHGDDVASAGVSVSTQIVSKATEILLDMLKVAIEKEREAARLKQSEKSRYCQAAR